MEDDRHLINKTNPGVLEDGAKSKTYYFNYYYYGETYSTAARNCKSLGKGWDVASFQTLFEFKTSLYLLNDKHSDLYLKSLYNLELVIFITLFNIFFKFLDFK